MFYYDLSECIKLVQAAGYSTCSIVQRSILEGVHYEGFYIQYFFSVSVSESLELQYKTNGFHFMESIVGRKGIG